MTTLFKKIIDKQIPSTIVFENARILVIEDIMPKAPVHLLILPKQEIARLQDVTPQDLPLLQEMLAVAQQLAEDKGVADGYRIVINNGAEAGQTIFHLHIHLIGGKALGPMA